MIESLKELDQLLLNNLNLIYGDSLEVLKDISEKNNVNAIFTNTDYTPFALKRDEELLQFCKEKSLDF